MKILIIEDNDILRENIQKYLEIQNFEIDTHTTYEWAYSKIKMRKYDAVILDVWLKSTQWDGISLCKEIRHSGDNIPILMLTARALKEQKIEWLDVGADDYMIKPFDYEELFARLKSVTRRNDILKWTSFIHKNLEINDTKKEVFLDGMSISLSRLEYNLLFFFLRNKGDVLEKNYIYEKVWGEYEMFKENRNVDIFVGYLRKKLWKDIIETVHGVGYILK